MAERNDFDTLQTQSIDVLKRYFKGEFKTDQMKPKIALGTLSVISRIKATERVKDATQIAVLRGIAKDEVEYKEYLRLSLPHLCPAKK